MHRRSTLRIAVAVALAALAIPVGTVRAAPKPDGPSALCLSAIQAAERRYDTPPGLLAVMAKVESGRATSSGDLQPWPWTVDADGQGAFFASKTQAVEWSRQALASGAVTYLDVGCMQVDLRMHPNAFRSLEEAF
ncbi:MAG TPA: lytic transglycosylase, partial [Acetobacteraceae bacterium]|nr:lytic transglycosylase [Acetobacteraceae bacterium]